MWNIDILDTYTFRFFRYRYPHFFVSKTSWRYLKDMSLGRHEDMSLRRLEDMSWRRLEDIFSRRLADVFNVTIFRLPRCLEDVLKTFSRRLVRCLQDFFKTSWKTKNCYAENIFKTSSRPRNVCWVKYCHSYHLQSRNMNFNFKSYTPCGSALLIIVIIIIVNTPQFLFKGLGVEPAQLQAANKRKNSWLMQCDHQKK